MKNIKIQIPIFTAASGMKEYSRWYLLTYIKRDNKLYAEHTIS